MPKIDRKICPIAETLKKRVENKHTFEKGRGNDEDQP